jgi:hypothetical protein
VLLPATQQDAQAIRAGDMITFFSWIEPKKKRAAQMCNPLNSGTKAGIKKDFQVAVMT